MSFDVDVIRRSFPILGRRMHGKPLVYLDNAATSQKPAPVIDALSNYYREINSNIHRGVYGISQEATEAYEMARETTRRFLNAAAKEEIIFTRGTTESINLVASSFSQRFIHAGDEVLVTAMEHHSNLVPWQLACARQQAVVKHIPLHEDGRLDLTALDRLLGPRTRLLALTHVSNVTGHINPVKEIIARAHAMNIPVLVDGAQAVPHLNVDVQEIDCDFYAFSGHKMYGPMGIGVLYGKRSFLEEIPPWQGGGEMIDEVSLEGSTFNELPYKFEAGTSNVAGAVGLQAAMDFMQGVPMAEAHQYEAELLQYARDRLSGIPGLRTVGDLPENIGVLSFVVDSIHPYDLGTLLDQFGVAVRTGNHCAQPLLAHFGISGTVRMSLAMYNTREEIDIFAASLEQAISILS